jgi:hypothetical protein
LLRRDEQQQPISIKALALSLPSEMPLLQFADPQRK